jgi:hypothetical protein
MRRIGTAISSARRQPVSVMVAISSCARVLICKGSAKNAGTMFERRGG